MPEPPTFLSYATTAADVARLRAVGLSERAIFEATRRAAASAPSPA